MHLTDKNKLSFTNVIKDKLSQFSEVNKVILFGSFVKSNNPNDIDIAIIQNSNDNFLTLSLKYRKVLRDLSKLIPLDIVPVKQNSTGSFFDEINKGTVVYERWTRQWLNYANENLESSKILLESFLFNPSLQNAQQSIEKNIKACFVEKGFKLHKTHNIRTLTEILKKNEVLVGITEDDIDLIDSIYLSSKYPFGSVLPDFEPDEKICLKCIDIALHIKEDIESCFEVKIALDTRIDKIVKQ